jgi:hypothetical protein
MSSRIDTRAQPISVARLSRIGYAVEMRTTTERGPMADEKMAADAGELRSFSHVLTALDEGTVHGDCTDRLEELLATLSKHADSFGKAKGTMTLKLSVTAERGGSVDLSADIEVKAPRFVRAKTVLWMSKGGKRLTGTNPKQLELGMPRVVGARPIRSDEEKH